ncbi:peptidase M23 [Enterococcus sp. JM4C]|uniref:M23 family metallopeptidase n=1 Tax=Candidatus Enterococcus huntleyi TaxID=1857217 RepID=UPI00137A1653|nr:M23 family metallopeptidase [Enterococcus sp. JM4C]KAF1297205.1 peptidase M23 [Enterococcus sp. JM4C]
MHTTHLEPLTIEFPLRGEWNALTSPADKVPSHGTDRMGLRYAFDFQQVDYLRKNTPFYKVSESRRILFGVPLKDCYGWGEPIYAPLNGEIVAVVDGHKERRIVHWLVESLIGLKKSLSFDESKHDFSRLAGNYVVLKCAPRVYIALVHMKKNSINVILGQQVKKGELLGEVGHSGNSTAPHLHLQVMDRPDFKEAQGFPVNFEEYEIYKNNSWHKVSQEIPSRKDRIRFLK